MFSIFLNSTFFLSPFSSSVFCPCSFSCSKQHVMALTTVHLLTLRLPPKCITNTNIINLVTQIVENRVGKILCHWVYHTTRQEAVSYNYTDKLSPDNTNSCKCSKVLSKDVTEEYQTSRELSAHYIANLKPLYSHCITHRHILYVKLS